MIMNLTQHTATPEQVEAGVVPVPEEYRELALQCLNFEGIVDPKEIGRRAEILAKIVQPTGIRRALIGGFPALMGTLERALMRYGIEPLYAFSVRVSEESTQPDGSIRKINIFKHAGFQPAGTVVDYMTNHGRKTMDEIHKLLADPQGD